MSKGRIEPYRDFIGVGITGVMELFTSAVCHSVMEHVQGPKIARVGAWVGGLLLGAKIGDDVTDYICDGVESFLDGLEEFKAAIDSAKEGN